MAVGPACLHGSRQVNGPAEEEKLLGTPEFQAKVADGIVDAVKKFRARYER